MELALKTDRPADVPRVRSAIGDQLRHLDIPVDTIDTATLLLSELVTNAIRHGSLPITCSMSYSHGQLRVEVCDASADAPVVVEAPVDSIGGRGMKLVSVLAHSWGWQVLTTGKCVWFELIV